MSDPGVYPPAPDYPPPLPAISWGPFTAGDLLRRTFQLYRDHFAVFLGISALAAVLSLVVQLPMQLLPFALRMQSPTPDPTQALSRMFLFFPLAILSVVIGMYIYALTYGAMYTAVSDLRQGRPISITGALEQTAPRSLRLLGAYFLAGLRIIGWLLLFMVVFIILAVLLVFAFSAGGMNLSSFRATPGAHQNFAALGAAFVVLGLLIVVGVLVYLFFVLWLYGRYLLFIPALLAENIGANASVNRSVELGKGSRGRIYALLIFCFLLQIIALACAAPFFFLAIHAGRIGPAASPIIAMAEFVVMTVVQMLLMHPVLGIGTALCYFDLRARKDAAPIAPPPLPTPAWEPPPAIIEPQPIAEPEPPSVIDSAPPPEPPPGSEPHA